MMDFIVSRLFIAWILCPYISSALGIHISDIEVAIRRRGSDGESNSEEYHSLRCEPESNWVTNCHSCTCSIYGEPLCKKIKNCVLRRKGEPMMCKPYSRFSLGMCNTCECNGDGVPVCTFMDCDQLGARFKARDHSEDCLKDFPSCSPGTVWKSNCYYCTCNSSGKRTCQLLYGCTLPPYGEPGRCRPNSFFEISCQQCSCNDEGQPNCQQSPSCE